ncbi:hypothetical protein DEM27_05145 [Metarhizobium album]|uniref:EamA domain-containing protein n=1 Tax=Metarhizobium album TaxID=2182425 RepID=A0A2U2DUN5_9HYPH|nr:hypothetical protein [Rhizobium album]PWE57033.1 hypothetical protein DEM27_05145 [Rhizobium album]
MNPSFLLWLAVALGTFLAAATASRAYIGSNSIPMLLFSLGLYCAGNLVMLKLMREGGLAMAVSISAIAQLLLINVIAMVVFGERLSTTQLIGVAVGAVAMALMLFPGPGKA